jgi:hypothetical protein
VLNCIVLDNKFLSIVFSNRDVMVPPPASSFCLLIKYSLYSSAYFYMSTFLKRFPSDNRFLLAIYNFFSYTFPACFSIVSNFICNVLGVPSFQLHILHITFGFSFSFFGGNGSINGNFETQSGWKPLPMSHWLFCLFP